MKRLATYDRKDYNPELPRTTKRSARAIIVKDDRVALLYSTKYEFYCFPGGALEEGETPVEALIRETREEAGLIVKLGSIKGFGEVLEIRKDMFEESIYEQHEYYYTCDTEDTIVEQKLTQSEQEAGYQLIFVSFDEAIKQNKLGVHVEPKYTEAETYVLNLLKDEYNDSHFT